VRMRRGASGETCLSPYRSSCSGVLPAIGGGTARESGAGLLKDAVVRAIQVTQEIAARALLVHAISEPARKFCLKFGFVESLINPMTLMLNLSRLPSPKS
jgi:hypothetical protein